MNNDLVQELGREGERERQAAHVPTCFHTFTDHVSSVHDPTRHQKNK